MAFTCCLLQHELLRSLVFILVHCQNTLSHISSPLFLSRQAAMYVQLTEAVEFCCSFLLAKICLENCAEVMRLLEDFSVGVEGVQEQLDNFLLDNFVPLMSRPDFLSYLGLERLQVCSLTQQISDRKTF